MPPGSATALAPASSTAQTPGTVPAAAPAAWTVIPIATVRKPIPLDNLVSGTVYAVQVQALGVRGLTTWSDSSTIMCT
jgi:hypothetical protein